MVRSKIVSRNECLFIYSSQNVCLCIFVLHKKTNKTALRVILLMQQAYNKTRISNVMDVKNNSPLHNVSYNYDVMGRITSEADSVDTNINNTYVYDSYGQLIRENNQTLDKTFIYCYDNLGNITSVKTYGYTTAETLTGNYSEKAFSYDSTLKDRLTGYGYDSLSYNSMGYPTSCGVKAFEWSKGKLAKLTKGLRL